LLYFLDEGFVANCNRLTPKKIFYRKSGVCPLFLYKRQLDYKAGAISFVFGCYSAPQTGNDFIDLPEADAAAAFLVGFKWFKEQVNGSKSRSGNKSSLIPGPLSTTSIIACLLLVLFLKALIRRQ